MADVVFAGDPLVLKHELIVGQDPIIRTRAFLVKFFPDATILPEPPEKWLWDKLLVTVSDVGGAGRFAAVMDDARVMVEVSHPDQLVASEAARKIYALLIEWPRFESGVFYRGTVMRPTYQPDQLTRVPAYAMTVNLFFRGDSVEVSRPA